MEFHDRILPPNDALHFVLPLGPSVNHLYQGTGKGMTRTDEYVAWQDVAAKEIMMQRSYMPKKNIGTGEYCAAIMVSPKAARLMSKTEGPKGARRNTKYMSMSTDIIDLDNRLKAIFDVLRFMQVTPDDKWLYSFIMAREPLMADGQSQVAVWPLKLRN